jgi:hypothetical protein
MTSPRRANGRFNKFVQESDISGSVLPFVHTTKAYDFDDMLHAGCLTPSKCDIFGEDLVYLFYGRPAYRVKQSQNQSLEFEWPIVLIFKPDCVSSIKRVFPFDSGAFGKGLYQEYFSSKSQIEDFQVEPNIEGVQKIVSKFYQKNKDYIIGSTSRQFEAQGVYELMRLLGVLMSDGSTRVRDDRSTSIEVQISYNLHFKDNILGVIIPEVYLDDDEVLSSFREWGVENIKTYSTINNVPGENWVGQLYARTIDLYAELELLGPST